MTVFDLEARSSRTVDCSKWGRLFDVQVDHRGELLAIVPRGDPVDVLLVSVASQALVSQLPIQRDYFWTLFLDERRLLVVREFAKAPVTEIWDVKTSSRLESLPHISGNRAVATRDGRFIAHELYAGMILVRDTLEQGQVKAWLDAEGVRNSDSASHVVQLAFSPDGKELACYWGMGIHPNNSMFLMSWDWSRQKHVEKIEYRRQHEIGVPAHPWGVQWFPDRKGWLVGDDMLVERGHKYTEMMSSARKNSPTLQSFVLADGAIADVDLSDNQGTVTYRRPPIPATPAPEVAPPAVTPSLVFEPSPPSRPLEELKADTEFEFPDHVKLMADGRWPYAIRYEPNQLSFLNFLTGKSTPLETPGATLRLLDTAADGRWCIIQGVSDRPPPPRRGMRNTQFLSVFETARGGRHMANLMSLSKLHTAYFVSDDSFLAACDSGWGVFRHVSRDMHRVLPRLAINGPSAVSPSGRYLAEFDAPWLAITDVQNGRVVGQMRVEMPAGFEATSLAFNVDATQIALGLKRTGRDSTGLLVYDLASRKPITPNVATEEWSVSSSPVGLDRKRWRWGDHLFAEDGSMLGCLLDGAAKAQVVMAAGQKMVVREYPPAGRIGGRIAVRPIPDPLHKPRPPAVP